MQGVLTPTIEFWVFESPGGLPSPIFESVNGDLTLPSKWGCDIISFFYWLIISYFYWLFILFLLLYISIDDHELWN